MKIRHLASLACAFIVLSGLLRADDQEDSKEKDKITSLMDSMAGTIYKVAWPTATYKSWEFDDFRRTQGGYRLVIKLCGLSAFDGSSLWLKLSFLVNSDGLKNVRVLDHNAILMPPFKTSEAIGSIGLQLAKQYAETHRVRAATAETPTTTPSYTPTQAGAICIMNSTYQNLSFSYHWGGGPWKSETVEAGKAYVLWWPCESETQRQSPQFEIEYDDSFAEGYTGQKYVLERYATSLPVSCENSKQYRFTAEGQKIFLNQSN